MTGSRFNEFIDVEEGVNCRLESADSALWLWKEKELLKLRFRVWCYIECGIAIHTWIAWALMRKMNWDPVAKWIGCHRSLAGGCWRRKVPSTPWQRSGRPPLRWWWRRCTWRSCWWCPPISYRIPINTQTRKRNELNSLRYSGERQWGTAASNRTIPPGRELSIDLHRGHRPKRRLARIRRTSGRRSRISGPCKWRPCRWNRGSCGVCRTRSGTSSCSPSFRNISTKKEKVNWMKD